MKFDRLKFSDSKEVTRLTNGKVCKYWLKIINVPVSTIVMDYSVIDRMFRFVSWVNHYYGINITYKVLKSNKN